LIKSTHACRRLRNTFNIAISAPCGLSWTSRTSTKHAPSSSAHNVPLGNLSPQIPTHQLHDAVSLSIPHIRRLKSLTVHADILPDILSYFYRPTPLLEKLDINLSVCLAPILGRALFGGDLSPSRELYMDRDTTRLRWKYLANLNVLSIISPPLGQEATQLLDYFESAPFLHTISLTDSILSVSDAPHERTAPLRHLVFTSGAEVCPLLDYLPGGSPNLENLAHITAVNLCFSWLQRSVRLSGSSGSCRLR
jgi:hypothetical protein